MIIIVRRAILSPLRMLEAPTRRDAIRLRAVRWVRAREGNWPVVDFGGMNRGPVLRRQDVEGLDISWHVHTVRLYRRTLDSFDR